MVTRRGVMALAALGGVFAATGAAEAREMVKFNDDIDAGTIIVKARERRLYFVNGDGTAVRYPVAVGRAGKGWSGEAAINGKHIAPAWMPPEEVKRDNPRLPEIIPGGAPNNPMGAAALTLNRGEYAIHGTNVPQSIGRAVSYGCIRMHNEHVLDLYSRVSVGTRVVMIP